MNKTILDKERSSRVIDELGGTVKVSKLCKVTPQAVSKWRLTGIPSARAMYLKAVRPRLQAWKS